MSAYEALAGVYDALTEDVGYRRRADYLEKLFQKSEIPVHTVLDLACGTGEMTAILTERGYELIASDASPDMLARAREKAAGLAGEPPVFLHQTMTGLDLYGTVDAAVCCLDSLNYLTSPKDVQKAFQRLHLFIAPGASLFLTSTAWRSWRPWTDRSFWTSGRTCTASGGRNMRRGAGSAPTGWTSSPAVPTADGAGAARSTGRGGIPWTSCGCG